MKGDGFLFKRGSVWWYGYSKGKRFCRESLKTDDEDLAKKRAKKIRDKLIAGTLLDTKERRVTVAQLLDDLEAHLRNKGRAYLPKAISHMKAVRLALGHLRADELDTAAVERFQADRRDAGRAPATINRGCELLREAFRLAHGRTPPKIARVPLIPLLPVNNARQGFLSRAEVDALLPALEDDDVRDFVEWLWWTGMRPGEIRQLTWEMLNRETWTLHLDPRAAKTRRGRTIALLTPAGEPTPLSKLMERRLKRQVPGCFLIFHRRGRGGDDQKGGKPGQPIRDFSKLWAAALKTAKLPQGLKPYDLRRSAIRNMVRAGVKESVAMRISGHRTRSTFDRYNITAEEDVAAAVEQTVAYVQALPTKRNVRSISGKKARRVSQFHHSRRR